MPKLTIVNGYSVYKDRATSLWIVKNRKNGNEVAHELNKSDAEIAANKN